MGAGTVRIYAPTGDGRIGATEPLTTEELGKFWLSVPDKPEPEPAPVAVGQNQRATSTVVLVW